MTMAEAITRLCQQYADAQFTVGAAIPAEKLRLACERFPIPHVRVLALLDTSNWSSRGSGLAVCEDGLCWKNSTTKAALLTNLMGKADPSGSARSRVVWAEFAASEIRPTTNPAVIEIAAGATLSLEGCNDPPAKMFSFLRDLQRLVRAASPGADEADERTSAPEVGEAAGRLREVVDGPLVRELIQQGISPGSLEWIVALDRLELRYGEVLDRVFLAHARGIGPILFGQDGPSGLRLFRDLDLAARLEVSASELLLIADPTRASPVKRGVLEWKRGSAPAAGYGDWIEFWAGAIGEVLGVEALTDLWLIAADRWEPGRDELGGLRRASTTDHLATVIGDEIRTWPPLPLPSPATTRTWDLRDGALWLGELSATGFATHALTCTSTLRGGVFRDRVGASLPRERRSWSGHLADYARSGMFETRSGSAQDATTALLRIGPGGAVTLEFAGGQDGHFDTAFHHGRSLVLGNAADRFAVVIADAEVGKAITAALPEPPGPPDGEEWPPVPFLDGDQPGGLCILRHGETSFRIDDRPAIAYENLSRVDVDDIDEPGLAALRLGWAGAAPDGERSFIGPAGVVYALAQALHTRRTKASVGSRGIAELYGESNRLKRDNLMYALFADIVVLNRSLEEGGPISDLLDAIGEADRDFSNDKPLRDRAIQKLAMLGQGLPRIKQKFEILAAYYPYYWFKRESDWLDTAFGGKVAGALIPKERERLISAVRRQVRAVHANIQRPLAEIEAALRPVEDLLATDEVRNTTSSRLRRHIPMAVSGASVASALVLGGPVAFLALGLGGHLTSTISQRFEKDKVAAARLRGVAVKVLAWWKVFMGTLAVSMYEADEFILRENDRAMLRDRAVIDSLDGERRKAVVGGLATALRRAILEESRSRFAEVLEGSGVRLDRISSDIRATVEVRMRSGVDEFCDGLALAGPGGMTREHANAG